MPLSLFENIQVGEPQGHGAVTVFPLAAQEDWGPGYLSLGEALEAGGFSVTEVSSAGSVPELKVTNDGERPVLLLDGEELKGAKQNRVLNTTVMVAARTAVVVPVTCTEQGRWRSESTRFATSPQCLFRRARAEKAKDVSDSLKQFRGHTSDQGKVWEDIRELACAAEVSSPTGAMNDVFFRREGDLGAYLAAFPLMPGQRGLLVFHRGLPAGLDLVSSERAFSRLHPKLVRSYCIEDALRPSKKKAFLRAADAEAFLKRAGSCPGQSFPSPGLGTDHRFESDGLVGSALEVDGAVVHAAFFTREENPKERREGGFAGFRQRRDNRSFHDPGTGE